MTKQKISFHNIETLTMNDIIEWAGSKITDRGVKYQKNKMVKDITITDNGTLLAYVDGTELYSVAVTIENGHLKSICSCPYGFNCKHGVATLLEYIERIKMKEVVQVTNIHDSRLQLLDEFNNDFNDDDESALDHNDTTLLSLELYLVNLNKEQLIRQICILSKTIPQVQEYFSRKTPDLNKDTSALLKKLHNEIIQVTQIVPWANHWTNECELPDYSNIHKMMQLLLEKSMYDELLSESKEFLELAIEQLNNSNDEGETWGEISTCIPLIVQALNSANMLEEDKLIWALNAVLNDDYDVCDDFKALLHNKHPITTWEKSIIYLQERLDKTPIDLYSFKRREVCTWLVYALEQAGRTEEILPTYESEAKLTNNYNDLIKYLIQHEKLSEALDWIKIGIKSTKEKKPRYINTLHNYERDIYKKQENWQPLFVLELIDFVKSPTLKAYKECCELAKKNSLQKIISTFLLEFLTTGKLPWEQQGWNAELNIQQIEIEKYRKFPDIHTLIDIAIDEQKADDVLKWYTLLPEGSNYDADNVATALQKKFTQEALNIWQKLTEDAVSLTTHRGYTEAETYLQKIKKSMISHNMQKDWLQYISSLRLKHARKRLFIQILNELDK